MRNLKKGQYVHHRNNTACFFQVIEVLNKKEVVIKQIDALYGDEPKIFTVYQADCKKDYI